MLHSNTLSVYESRTSSAMAPVLSGLTVSGNALILDFDRDLDLRFLSDRFETAQIRGRFFLQISGLRRDLVSLSATRERPRRLTLNFTGDAARSDQSLFLDYVDPTPFADDTLGVLQDLSGRDLRNLSRHADTFESATNVLRLAAGYRTLLLTGTAATGTGNASGNSIRVSQRSVDNTLSGLGGDDVIQAGDGNDKLIGGAGNDSMDGGSGQDLYVIERADEHTRAEINDTGIPLVLPMPSPTSNVDELRFAATSLVGGATLTVFAGDIGLEAVTIGTGLGATADSSGTLALNIDASAAPNSLLITGNAGANNLVGTRFADWLIGGAGSDVCDGREGSDIYLVTDVSHRATGEIRDSGSASDRDELRIAAPGLAGGPPEYWSIFANDRGLERVTIGTGFGVDPVTSGRGQISVNATAAVNALTIIGNDGINLLIGSSFADWIQGNNGDDHLEGGAGDDTLVGGLGYDNLRGDSGRNTFIFNTPLAEGSFDQITDFRPGEDRIQLSRSVFDLLPPGSTLAPDAFKVGVLADSPRQRILYGTITGSIVGGLWYDSDGSGGASPVLLARIDGAPPLSAADFQIVS